jgi:MraZ protein
MLTGTFTRAIDEKLRVAIPKLLRDILGCGAGGVLVLAPGTDGSLSLYTENAFSSLAERLARVSPTRQDVRAFNRLFYARAQQVEVDRQGRVRIPPELAQLIGQDDNVVLLGVQDHLEIWSARKWQTYLADKEPHYDEIAETAFQEAIEPNSA